MEMISLLKVTLVVTIFCNNFYKGAVAYVTQPQIRDLSNGHTIIGEDITLECNVSSNKPKVLLKWDSPLNLNLTTDRLNITTTSIKISPTLYTITSVYQLSKATLDDQRPYYCRVADVDNIFDNKYTYMWLHVYDTDQEVIKFYKKFVTFDKMNTQIQVFVVAHPHPTLHWLDNNNKSIDSNSTKMTSVVKPSSKFTNYEVILKFKNILPEDFGNYTLMVENKSGMKKLQVAVNMTGPPLGSTSVYYTNNKTLSLIKCQTIAYPKQTLYWNHGDCAGLSCFSKISPPELTYQQDDGVDTEEDGLELSSSYLISSAESGIVRCISNNSLGSYVATNFIHGVKKNIEVFAPYSTETDSGLKIETLYKENIEIICGVSLRDYYEEIKWFRVGRNMSLDDIRVPIRGFDEYHIDNFNAVYSSVSRMWVNVDKRDIGIYICKATRKDGTIDSKTIKVTAREQSVLNVVSNMENKTVQARLGHLWKFYCNVDGYPTPTINWFKNNKTIPSSEKMQIIDRNQTLVIKNIELNDNGTYKCVVVNRLNQTVFKIATLEAIENGFDWLLVVIIFLVLVLIGVVIFITVKLRKDYLLNKELQEAGLANFEKGAVEFLDPKLPLEDQANLLPYDKKWEIPEENLTLGKELGSGAFGVVYLGELRGLQSENETMKVAVKSVNKLAGFDCIKALASELKIMAHLGKHINVVNLIGAYTKDIAKRKLLVVVEYCPFGNLHEHLIHNSRNFIDQINKMNDQFDWTMDPFVRKSSSASYTTVAFSRSDSIDSGEVVMDEKATSKENESKSFSSKDLLTWAFQVATGMEYLASRRVLHGDLAARNLLMSDNNVIKIADFGLARSLYKNGVYMKKNKGPLPVKWMALESIGENIFSIESDVWSYGVVLWEFFSLGKTPYPGMQVDQAFYKLLFNGYRMEKPEYATQELYDVMLQCWTIEPMMRPSFKDLACKMASLLEKSVVDHYLNMSGSYIDMNNPEDYLQMVSPPTYQNTVSPNCNYVNNINYFNINENVQRYVNIEHKTDDKK